MLMDEMNVASRRTSEEHHTVAAKKAIHTMKTINWDCFNEYCVNNDVVRRDRQILQNSLQLAIFWDECSSMDDEKRMSLFLNTSAEAYKAAGIRFRTRSLREAEKRLSAHLKLMEDASFRTSGLGSHSSVYSHGSNRKDSDASYSSQDSWEEPSIQAKEPTIAEGAEAEIESVGNITVEDEISPNTETN